MLRIVTPWDSQPQEAVGVDSNASGVRALVGPFGEAVTRSNGMVASGSAPPMAVNSAGLAWQFSASAVEFPAVPFVPPPVTVILTAVKSNTPTEALISFGGSQSGLGWKIGSYLAADSFNVTFGGVADYPVTSSGWLVGKVATYVVVIKSNTIAVWRNGAKLAQVACGTPGTPTKPLTIGAAHSGTIYSDFSASNLNGAAIIGRAFSDGEAALASTGPHSIWSLYAPRTIWVPVSAGGGGASISGALGAAVASGFTGTINANRTIAGALGTATASGFTGTVSNSTNTAITGALGVATASGFTGTVGANRGIAGALGVAVASGFTGAVTNDNSTTISGALGTATASGFTGAITWNRYISGLLGEAQASGFAGGVQNGAAPVIATGGGIYPTPRRKTKQEIDADRKRLGILADEPEVQTGIVEVAPVKRPTITLEQLIGKPAADTHRADMERASAAHKLRKRRQDDDLLMMM